jgi:hypothetical protein
LPKALRRVYGERTTLSIRLPCGREPEFHIFISREAKTSGAVLQTEHSRARYK